MSEKCAGPECDGEPRYVIYFDDADRAAMVILPKCRTSDLFCEECAKQFREQHPPGA